MVRAGDVTALASRNEVLETDRWQGEINRIAAAGGGVVRLTEGRHRVGCLLLKSNVTLEILADHVRCSHGSASAPMDEEQLFYLLSRGIPRHQAQLLVAEGFLQDVAERFAEQ